MTEEDKAFNVYRPAKGKVPNLFVRWMMRICFDCLWVKEKK